MTTKLYLHDATSTDTGTLPSAKLSSLTYAFTMTGAATNRRMDATHGTSQVAPTVATVASATSQYGWFRRYVSAPLAAQTIGNGVHWMLQAAGATSNTTNSDWWGVSYYLGVWRPSSGAVVGTIYNSSGGGIESGPLMGATETLWGAAGGEVGAGDTGTVTCSDGDILVVEVGCHVNQAMATSYTHTFYYDGTTDDSITSCASYLISPTTLTFSTGAVAATSRPIQAALQAVKTAAAF